MGRTTPPTTTDDLSLADAMAHLGISARHVLSLAVDGRLVPTLDGGVTRASAARYAEVRTRALAGR